MNLIKVHEHRFYQTPDGNVWTPHIWGYSTWQRYLEVFEHVKVVTKVTAVDSVPDNWIRADCDGVIFYPFPYYAGYVDYLKNRSVYKRFAHRLLDSEDAIVLKGSSVLSTFFMPLLERAERPYGVEVTADPQDFYSPRARQHPLRPFLRWYFSHHLRRQCKRAYAAAYVTEKALQKRYPPGGLSTHYSSIDLSRDDIILKPRPVERFMKKEYTLIFVGFLLHLYKAQDILLKALSMCVQRGADIRLLMIGDGQKRPELEKMAEMLSLTDRVDFLGDINRREIIFENLDQSDLFVLPSRQEGLPRAMIEAMARGLPCIGSHVGGIPELLPPEYLVPPNDEHALADKIIEVIHDPARMARMSARNLELSRNYCLDVLTKRRVAFYTWIKDATEKWLAEKHSDRM